MEHNKKVIFYLNTYNNEIKIYNTYASHIHFGYFHFSNLKLYLNKKNPNDAYFNEMWFDLGISNEKNIKCIMVLNVKYIENDYNIYYNRLKEFIKTNTIIKGIDLDIENKISLENIKKLINDIKRDFPNLLICISTTGYSMCVKDLETIYADEKEWSYSLFNKSPEALNIDYYTCAFNEDDLTIDSFQDMLDNGFPPEKIVMGCYSKYFQDYDNYYELRCIAKKDINFGGTFIKYFNDSPYKWDLSVWLCLTSK
jgi:hypothetical protein